MALCEIDWKSLATLISPIITGTVALFIFFNWKNQKGAEAIALESKEAIKELLDLVYISGKLEHTPSYTTERNSMEFDVNQFFSVVDVVIKRLYFLDNAIYEPELKIFTENFQDYQSGFIKFHDRRINNLVPISNLLIADSNIVIPSSNYRSFEKYKSYIDNILQILQPYSTFQKTPKFK
ncbi:hypothetical protein [Acinetobacter sp.]|jgi:hypothetical protein|uniref:hypothetical protein n=1 Tax=Acinetobacter sp. TaxID=472 RepID=UPI00282A14F8|nr:hypothetical protein [Acinetobacter sp.]MDR0238123.1 hypothetical protein [Acinetobacter sp.]